MQNVYDFHILPFCHLDDEQFKVEIFEMNQGLINSFSRDRLDSLCFNPLNTDSCITSIADLDPDQQFLHQYHSNYYVPDQFNAIITKPESTFSMMHLNARSLNQNLTNLTDFLTTTDITFSIFGISETWLQSSRCFYSY